MDTLDLKYIRGYAITREPLVIDGNWVGFNKFDYYFYFHPQTKWAYKEAGDLWVCIIGRALDVNNSTDDLKRISQILLEKYKKNLNDIFDYTDELIGRYIVVVGDKRKAIIYNDAIGMKAIFYNSANGYIASHAKLLSEISNSDNTYTVEAKWLREYSAYHLPGNLTIYKNIFQLIPNHYINLSSLEITRYFPRENLVQLSVNEAASEIIKIINKQLDLLNNKKIILSLSGGMDSRTSLALLKNKVSDLTLFTYFLRDSQDSSYKGNSILNTDEAIVKDMINNLHLNHKFIPIDISKFDSIDFNYFKNILKQNTYLSHNYKLAKLYYDYFKDEDVLHIRSNSYEVGRAILRKAYNFGKKEMTIENQITCYSPKAINDDTIKDIVKDYNISFDPRGHYNYDPYDLQHWEWRLGLWHSHVLIESDLAFDTHILINSHKIYKLLLSVPLSDRKKGTLFRKLIELNWPVLLFWDINNRNTLLDRYDSQIVDYGLNLQDIIFKSGNMDDPESNVPYFGNLYVKSAKMYIDKSDPQKGDYVEATKQINTKLTEEKEVVVNLRVPFEAKHLSNRLKYQVFCNNKLILEEDVAFWQETNEIIIPVTSDIHEIKLSFKVIAIKDCEPWSLGKAATLIIERIILRKQSLKSRQVQASSPFSKIFKNYV
ncbi:hypothetical protein CAI16_19010 [Virgibacillus dokdonensis]|uniref:Asparagine synthetase domain-containing protein n=1 Tax=Virgibacillus dokdonensis TaxID=302167 RepID=A0A3E0WIW5_9BACI|nr:hypothetical protein [Virgibacillus dokdonensis]RFA32091.1 hypothetical protein CAI16_19010 [Virgibacillus dokdonensis]